MAKSGNSLLAILFAGSVLFSKNSFSQQDSQAQSNRLIKQATIMKYFDMGEYEYMVNINFQHYLKYKKLPHPPSNKNNLLKYSTPEDSIIKKISMDICENLEEKTNEKKAQALLDFVHKHVYLDDINNYIKTPVETIVEEKGDCEDLSVLGYSLMKSAGIDVVYLYVERKDSVKGENIGYVFLGINGNFYGTYTEHNGKKYFIAETTGTEWPDKPTDWKIGECPSEYEGKSVEVISE